MYLTSQSKLRWKAKILQTCSNNTDDTEHILHTCTYKGRKLKGRKSDSNKTVQYGYFNCPFNNLAPDLIFNEHVNSNDNS